LSEQLTTEQGRTQQPTIDGSSKDKQWLATTRVRGQWLAMVAKGGGSQRRDCRGQRGVIAESEAAEAPWIWTTKCEGGSKQEDGSVFWKQGQLLW
jgi:hypothetical protein